MLSLEQYEIIESQLKKENANEFVIALLSAYANDISRASELLAFIPKLADKQLKMKQKRINEYSWAFDLLLGERVRYPIEKRKNKKGKEYNPDFPTLLYGCKAHFPNGNCDGGSLADKDFFNSFITILKDKDGFDYNKNDDWKWACDIANCREWLKSVITQNIDENFIEPKVEKVWHLEV